MAILAPSCARSTVSNPRRRAAGPCQQPAQRRSASRAGARVAIGDRPAECASPRLWATTPAARSAQTGSELGAFLEPVPVLLYAGQATAIAGRGADSLARGVADNVRFAPGKGLLIGQLLGGSVRRGGNHKHRGKRQQIYSRASAKFEHDDLPGGPKSGAKQALRLSA